VVGSMGCSNDKGFTELTPAKLPIAFGAQTEFRMRVVCSWCQTEVGTKPCDPAAHGTASHTICQLCQQNFLPAQILKCSAELENKLSQ
jgi:hypothetical protein